MRDGSRRVTARPVDVVDSPTDRTLLLRLRAGDDAAFGVLYRRHSAAIRGFAATQVRDATDAEDLTAEAFFRVLQTVRNGAGPDTHVRAYLVTVVRRIAVEWATRRADVPVSDEELAAYREPRSDGVNRRIERSLVAAAFRSLPERWRNVLWRVEVEGQRPANAARYFGLSANATAALARRARDGLRAAYLQAHLARDDRADGLCRSVTEKLGAYTSGGLRGAEARRVRAHLSGCPACRALAVELSEVCSALRSVSGLIVLSVAGVAAAGLASSATSGGTAAAGGVAAAGRLGTLGVRAKLGLVAASAGAVGALGLGAGTVLETTPGVFGLPGQHHADVLRVVPDSSSAGERRSDPGYPAGPRPGTWPGGARGGGSAGHPDAGSAGRSSHGRSHQPVAVNAPGSFRDAGTQQPSGPRNTPVSGTPELSGTSCTGPSGSDSPSVLPLIPPSDPPTGEVPPSGTPTSDPSSGASPTPSSPAVTTSAE